uniref:Uncharacterized protein n=1 Tax=Arundo donax TaxID=35708 RepID=A0A0A9BY17_ARUDO
MQLIRASQLQFFFVAIWENSLICFSVLF